jgi:hypothetical protein
MLYPINAIAMDDCKAGTCIVPAVNDASLIAGVVAEGLESPTSMAFLGLDDIGRGKYSSLQYHSFFYSSSCALVLKSLSPSVINPLHNFFPLSASSY